MNPITDGGMKNTDASDDDELDPADKPSDGADSPDEGDEPKLSLSKTQLEKAGLGDLQEGDSFTVTLHGTATETSDASGIVADVDELTDGMIEGLTAPPMAKPPLPQGPTIKGPAAAGMMTPSSPLFPDQAG